MLKFINFIKLILHFPENFHQPFYISYKFILLFSTLNLDLNSFLI